MRIIDDNFELNKIDKYPTLMAQGNGYLGLRSIQEEPFYNQTLGMYLAGIFNKNPDSETSELVNLPDVLTMTIKINDEVFSLQSDKVIKYKRQLDLASGELTKEVVWESGKNMLALTFKRVVGQKKFQIVAQQLRLKAISGSFTITLESGINGQITNFGTQQYTVEDYRVINDR